MWRLRGTVVYINTPGKNVRVPVCGAIRYPDGPFVYQAGQVNKHPDTETFIGMIDKLVARAKRTGKRIILVLDNGSAHTSHKAQERLKEVRDVINIFLLPPSILQNN